MSEPVVVVVGGADTGRAPMAAALLGRIVASQGLGWLVLSAGVVGHDGDPAEPEARSALLAMGLDLSGHMARSLSVELAASARLLVAVERGVALVVRARYPGVAVATLGELAGRARDIPDPFRMQVGAWVQYAGEIEALLRAGMPRLQALVEGGLDQGGAGPAPGEEGPGRAGPAPEEEGPGRAGPAPGEQRLAAVERAWRLLGLVAELPAVVDWGAARGQLEADLALMERPLAPGDLSGPYVALVRALLARAAGAPTPAQAEATCAAVGRLRTPIGAAELELITRELSSLRG